MYSTALFAMFPIFGISKLKRVGIHASWLNIKLKVTSQVEQCGNTLYAIAAMWAMLSKSVALLLILFTMILSEMNTFFQLLSFLLGYKRGVHLGKA